MEQDHPNKLSLGKVTIAGQEHIIQAEIVESCSNICNQLGTVEESILNVPLEVSITMEMVEKGAVALQEFLDNEREGSVPALLHWPSEDEMELHVGRAIVKNFICNQEPGRLIDGVVRFEWEMEWIEGPVVLGWNGAD
jgi:hypothetical protein